MPRFRRVEVIGAGPGKEGLIVNAYEQTEGDARVPAHRAAVRLPPVPADTLVQIDIGEMTLSGFSFVPSDERIVRSAIETELARLIAMGPLPRRLSAGGTIPRLPGRPLEIACETDPQRLGRSIATALYRGMQR